MYLNFKFMKINVFLLIFFIGISIAIHAQSPYINKVFDYCPAPGQFVNTLPKYDEGDTREDMIRKVEESIAGERKELVSLGAYGGYVVFGFDHLVENRHGKYDFKIWGNAVYNNANLEVGTCEPGIVMVSYDANGNGIPDDTWYELAGSEYFKPQTIKNYEITYYKPDPNKEPVPHPYIPFLTDTSYIKWTSNQGDCGYVAHNTFHSQPYYPQWISAETLVYAGTKLANNGVDENGTGQNFVQHAYPWGYADNHPNNNIRSGFDIDWAVDEQGNKVNLTGIHFIKVYTAVNQYCGMSGETSTEIMGAEDFHIQGIDIDVLKTPTETLPNARVYYTQGKLCMENLADCQCTLFDINGQVMQRFYVTSSNDTHEINTISGVYLLKVQKQNEVKIFKFIIN